MGFYYELFPCTYAIIKEMVAERFEKWHVSLISAMALILTIVFFAIGFLFLFPWFIYYFMVKIYLVFRHRDKFRGFLSLNAVMEHAKTTITVVYILEHHGSYEELLVNVMMSCQNLMRSHYRFTSTVRKCSGYYYFLKEQVSIHHVVSTAEEQCSTKNDLLDYLQKKCFRYLDAAVKLWSVKVFRNPIAWNEDNKACYYPVVMTYNHCLADAICLSVFQQKYLLEDVDKRMFENAFRKPKPRQGNIIKSNASHIRLLASEKSLTLLKNPESPSQNLALFIEKEPKYLGVIRGLSKRFQCTFTDVLLMVSVVVLTDYLEEKNIFPRKILVSNTRRILNEDTWALLNGRIFDNELSLDLYALPDVKSKSSLEKLLKLSELLNIQRNLSTSQFLYVCHRIMTYLPAEAMVRLCRPIGRRSLLCVTNIPGVEFARFGGAIVKDSFLFVNQTMETKFIMGVHSHGGRLQVSLISGKHIITSKEDLQEILNKVFKVIDEFCE